MDEDGAFDSGFDDGGPFRVTPEAGGVSLESALRDYGPAAIDDLIPRLRAIARDLDAAHAAGHVHGALHPSKVIVHDDATSLVAGTLPVQPYSAPETADGSATPASDQFSLAAIAYEWLFGRPIGHPAHRAVEVRTIPGVNRVALSKAFTRALAPDPANRFASCAAFCGAIAGAVTPKVPLLALEAEDEHDDPVGPFVPESAPPLAVDSDDAYLDHSLAASLDEVAMVKEADLRTIDPIDPIDPIVTHSAAVASWNPGASSSPIPSREPQRFGGGALILALAVGAIFGFAAGYMARPRALQSGAPQEFATAQNAGAAGATGATGAAVATGATAATSKAPEKASAGRLLVRSTPSGASVSVDGVAKGATPLALRDLDLGTRNIVIARRGYIPETRNVMITSARPARSLDVRLSAGAVAAPARPSTSAANGRSGATSPKLARPPASAGGSAASTGSLNVDSRPSGAAVTINGKPSGSTPLTIDDLAAGEYRIVMTMTGYRSFASTVRVVAGERVRAAASLTAQEQE